MIIGGLVAGFLVFVWQTLSWTALNLHGNVQKYSAGQDSILAKLSNSFTEEGTYVLPNLPPTATMQDMEKFTQDIAGKPWYTITYHSAYKVNMMTNIIRGLLTDIAMMIVVCWFFLQFGNLSFGKIFSSCLVIGLASFIYYPYTGHIWYPSVGILIDFVDAFAGWGLAGLWLGYWLPKK